MIAEDSEVGKATENATEINGDESMWCPRRDSNPHTLADIRF